MIADMEELWIRAVPVAAALSLFTAVRAQTADATPADAFVGRLEERLRKHPFFTKIDYDKETRHAPFVFFVERPRKADATYVRAIVNVQVPFMRELLRVFESTYAGPLELRRHDSAPAFAIAILNSRGSYDEYARATKAPGLHAARAHYDSGLQLVVSYEDVFNDDPASANVDERQSLLHETVHALQHAYSADGQMPSGLWFVEGLAEYRSACGHLPDRLATPQLSPVAMHVLAAAAGRPELRHHLAGLEELLNARSYVDVVKFARARGRKAGQTSPNDDFALGVFYAQAAMFVRFLHEGEGERYRPAFMQCMRHLMRGSTSSAAWAEAFGDVDVAELDRQFRVWLSDTISERGGIAMPALAPRTPADPAVVMGSLTKSTFDPKSLAWRAEEAGFRRTAARQLCGAGDYEGAVRILPVADDGGTAEVGDERARIEAVRALRDRVVDDLVQSRRMVRLDVGGGRTASVRLVKRTAAAITAAETGKAEVALPLHVITPRVLLAHVWSKKWLTGSELWLERWLRWLDGTPMDKLRPLLAGEDPMLVALRRDLTEPFVADLQVRSLATALQALQDLPLGDDPKTAGKQLAELVEMARAHAAQPVFASRRAALSAAARALAERAFTLDNAAAFGLSGAVQTLPGNRFRVVYEGDKHRTFDLKPDQAYLQKLPRQPVGIAFSGEPVLRPAGRGHELIGEGFFRWPIPLRGKLVVEFDQSLAVGGQMHVVFCDDGEGSHLEGDPFGLSVFDLQSQPPVVDHVGALQWQYEPDRIYRVRIEHDGGNQARVLLDGVERSPWRAVGTRSHGWLGLYVFSSNPIVVHRLVIEGEFDTSAIPALRERFVQENVAAVGGEGR